jgi:hypothetical protein
MSEAYDVAALRHWVDGNLLETSGRVPNADHLYGFAAECAIKSALATLLPAAATGQLERRYREHIDKLWALVLLQNIQRRFPALHAILRTPNAFHDWSTHHRYTDGSPVTPQMIARHRKASQRLLAAVGLGGVRRTT